MENIIRKRSKLSSVSLIKRIAVITALFITSVNVQAIPISITDVFNTRMRDSSPTASGVFDLDEYVRNSADLQDWSGVSIDSARVTFYLKDEYDYYDTSVEYEERTKQTYGYVGGDNLYDSKAQWHRIEDRETTTKTDNQRELVDLYVGDADNKETLTDVAPDHQIETFRTDYLRTNAATQIRTANCPDDRYKSNGYLCNKWGVYPAAPDKYIYETTYWDIRMVDVSIADAFDTAGYTVDIADNLLDDFNSTHLLNYGATSTLGSATFVSAVINLEVSEILPSPVPEPAALALFGLGIAGLFGANRKRRSNKG